MREHEAALRAKVQRRSETADVSDGESESEGVYGACERVLRENDALRAENERLRMALMRAAWGSRASEVETWDGATSARADDEMRRLVVN